MTAPARVAASVLVVRVADTAASVVTTPGRVTANAHGHRDRARASRRRALRREFGRYRRDRPQGARSPLGAARAVFPKCWRSSAGRPIREDRRRTWCYPRIGPSRCATISWPRVGVRPGARRVSRRGDGHGRHVAEKYAHDRIVQINLVGTGWAPDQGRIAGSGSSDRTGAAAPEVDSPSIVTHIGASGAYKESALTSKPDRSRDGRCPALLECPRR